MRIRRLFFTLRGINIDDLITQTVTDTAQTLLGKAERQSQHILHDVDLGDVFGIQLDDIAMSLPDLPAVQPTPSTAEKQTAHRPQDHCQQAGNASRQQDGQQNPVSCHRHRSRSQENRTGSVPTTRTVTKPVVPVAPPAATRAPCWRR